MNIKRTSVPKFGKKYIYNYTKNICIKYTNNKL